MTLQQLSCYMWCKSFMTRCRCSAQQQHAQFFTDQTDVMLDQQLSWSSCAQSTGVSLQCVQLWALGQNGELQFLRMFAQTASPVRSITLHASKQSILLAVADGSISLWQLDTLGELYRYKHEGPVEGLTFTATDDFYFFSGQQVDNTTLNHILLTDCRSGITPIRVS